MRNESASWKFPPALGRERSILVESDNTYPDPENPRRLRGGTGTERFLRAVEELRSKHSGFSLVVTPETPLHPEGITPRIGSMLNEWRTGSKILIARIEQDYHSGREIPHRIQKERL